MFEALCGLLLRLYPAAFRDAHGAEALQLMRDRARDERGLFRRARLLMDLGLDLAVTSVRAWQAGPPLLATVDRPPRFDVIDAHRPSLAALAVGMMVSILMFAGFTQLFQENRLRKAAAFLIGHFGDDGESAPAHHAAQQQQQRQRQQQPPPQSQQSQQQAQTQSALAGDREARRRLVAAIAANMQARYHDRAIGRQLSDAMLAQDARGAYDALDEGSDLAVKLNTDIQQTLRRLDVPRGQFVADVVYVASPIPAGPPPPMTEEARERQRAMLLARNCLVERTETLPPRNIGYLKLDGFADVDTCRPTMVKAMAALNDVESLIIDLRDNRGGFGETARLMAGYLFDRPAFLFDPRANSPVPLRTASPVPGSRLADTPVYVLTSSSTQSAAEYLVYNLKMLKRATIVGETTAGRQHSGGFHRLTEHFGMGIQEVPPPENPYPVKGWEVIGIEPDVKVPRARAFETAKQLAEARAGVRTETRAGVRKTAQTGSGRP